MDRFRRPKPLNKRLQTTLLEVEQHSIPVQAETDQLSTNIKENEESLRGIFQGCSDVVFRAIPADNPTQILIIYIDGLIDTKILDESVLKPLMFHGLPQGFGTVPSMGDVLRNHLIAVSQTFTITKVQDSVEAVLQGNVVFITDGCTEVLVAALKGFEKRAVEEPQSEISVRGPRVGFTETLRVNTSLLRRSIRSPKLKMDVRTLGEFTKSTVVITYIEGIVPDTLLQEVRSRMDRIRTDSILESGYIEEFIEDVPFSPFPQIQNTERPDVVVASLLEGRVAILVDGSPFVLIAPMTFWTALQAAEDYYERFMYTTFIRWLRMILLNISLFLPSLYVAVTSYHPQLLPTNLLISISAAREGVPFPAVIEAFLMEFMFEGLREAGVRLPKPIGSAVSIVGALVIGQAAVEAGIVSAPMVIVVAVTGIASFAIPRYNLGTAYRMLRFPLLFLSGIFGLYGTAMGAIAILSHMANLRSFGVPYLLPVAPQMPGRNLKDTLLRAPHWSMGYRPAFIVGRNRQRVPEGQMPGPQQGKKDR